VVRSAVKGMDASIRRLPLEQLLHNLADLDDVPLFTGGQNPFHPTVEPSGLIVIRLSDVFYSRRQFGLFLGEFRE
jgi:hypothetical protein